MGRVIERGAIYILVVGAPQVIIWSKTAENANKMEWGGVFPLAWLALIHALGVLLLVYLYFSGSCFSLSLIPISVCPPGKSQLFSHGLHPWHSRAGCVIHLGHTNPDLDWRWRGWIQRVRGYFFSFFIILSLCLSFWAVSSSREASRHLLSPHTRRATLSVGVDPCDWFRIDWVGCVCAPALCVYI